MNFEPFPDQAKMALKRMMRLLDQPVFDEELATYEGIKFVVAALKPRMVTRPTLYLQLEELLLRGQDADRE